MDNEFADRNPTQRELDIYRNRYDELVNEIESENKTLFHYQYLSIFGALNVIYVLIFVVALIFYHMGFDINKSNISEAAEAFLFFYSAVLLVHYIYSYKTKRPLYGFKDNIEKIIENNRQIDSIRNLFKSKL